ncbi:hypothetical protein OG885_09685 [Streptomyces sp. NBC_00028]|uniref:hypothetical protein n=1 Tax=Streptomyces sp. NBC_00028 TaxID=2975624 RepID=UPI0032527148
MTGRTPDALAHDSTPDVGAVMVDRRNGRVGVVMGHVGPYVQLRPPHGGREWDVPPDDTRAPTPAETLGTKGSVAHRKSGR